MMASFQTRIAWLLIVFIFAHVCNGTEIPADPVLVVNEVLAFDSMRGWESAIIEDPERFRPILELRAKEDLPLLAQLKLVEIGFHVFDEVTFVREANEALTELEKSEEKNVVVLEHIDRLNYLIKARAEFDKSEESPANQVREVLTQQNSKAVNISTAKTEEENRESPPTSLSPWLPWFLGVVALLVIFVILGRSFRGKGDQP